MFGTIKTYQKCPRCGAAFPSSKGEFPIVCKNGCMTQPTKFFISLKWKGVAEKLYHDRDGSTIHSWAHVVAVIGDIRSRVASHKKRKGYFDPSAYKGESKTSFKKFWKRFEAGYDDAALDKIKAIGTHHMTYFDEYQMNDIVPWNVDEWWKKLSKKELSQSYMADILTWAKTFFRYARRMDLNISEKVLDYLAGIKVDVPEPDIQDWYTEEKHLAILDALPPYDRPIYDFMFLTGCRVGEACALQKQDIKRDIEKVIIANTVKRDGSIGIVKNKKQRRIPYIGEIKACIKAGMKITGLKIAFVFTNKWGRRYSDDYLRKTLYQTCDKIGIERIKLKNATRTSFAMELMRRGHGPNRVAEVMNITNGKVIKHYARMHDKDIEAAYGRTGNGPGCHKGAKQ